MPLRADEITIKYGAMTALDALSIEVRPGEITSLIGPNGSGKSTALHALAGLARCTSGTVRLDARPLETWRRRDLAKRLSFLPQNPTSPENMSVEQLVRQGRFAHLGLFQSFSRKDLAVVDWALEQTGLVALADRDLANLSGGERQRAWIAAALAQEAEILLLDEPTSFLDIGHQVEVLELLKRLSTERGIAVVLAIHDLNHAMAVADNVLLLCKGKLVFEGRSHELASTNYLQTTFEVQGSFEAAASGEPYFRVPLGSVPSQDPRSAAAFTAPAHN